MEKRLIDINPIIGDLTTMKSMYDAIALDGMIKALEEAPAVDAAPVVPGQWVGSGDGYADGELVYDMWACSECGYDADGADEKPQWRFCPNCGAKMDGGDDNAAD